MAKETDMTPHDQPPRIIDLITSYGRKKSPPSKRTRDTAVVAVLQSNDPSSSHEQRLKASNLRPTIARTNILDALEKAEPRCLDASQLYRDLSSRKESLAPATIYRGLNDLWAAGLLVRTHGARGRAFYAPKPDKQDIHNDTLRCGCGARLVFIDDQTLRESLRSRAAEEGFELGHQSTFTITLNCSECPASRQRGR